MSGAEKLIIKADELEKRVDDYCNKIINGKINACKKHIWACKRYFKFKEKYIFDKIELLKFYVWAKQFKHRAGILNGQSIDLAEFNLFEAAFVLCFKNEKGLRIIRKVYIQTGRKNVKTQFMALISSYIGANSKDEQQEIYIAGWDKSQSDICFREIDYQLSSSKRMKEKYKNSYGKITFLRDGSFIKPLSREARNTGDGTNPSVGIIDEYHAHKTSEIYDVINSGMVARAEPLMIVITTAGFDLSVPCYKEYQYVSKVLNPDLKDIENDEYCIIICELEKDDDVKDESNWIKANPIVATYEGGMNYLRGELKAALSAPEKMRGFLTKNMNRWVDMKEDGYMDMKKWNDASTDLTLNDFIGEDSVLGVDLSTKLDLTSIGYEFCKDGIYYVGQHSFMPEESYEKRMRESKYRFDLWKEEGDLTIIPGAVIDYSYIRDTIKDLEEMYNIKFLEVCYDPYNASQFVQELEFEGYVCVEIRQGPYTLNEPTKDFRDKVYSGDMKHFKDGLLDWAIGNAVATQHKQEYIMLDKKKSSEKIDPCAAIINAHTRATKILNVYGGSGLFYSPSC